MKRLAATAAAVATGVALVFAAVAPAKTIELVAYTGDTYTGAGSTGGAFTTGIVDVGVHQASGTILVLTNNGITRLNSDGEPENFPATGTSTIPGSFFGEIPALAVDNTGGPTDGNFYVAAESGPIRAFKLDGTELGGNFPLGGHATNCGHAVDPQGDIWVGNYGSGQVVEYTPAGVATGASFPNSSVCRLAIDKDGNFYVSTYTSPLRKYDPSGNFLFNVDTNAAWAVAVNPDTGEVFVSHQSRIDAYAPNGGPITSFGQAEGEFPGIVGAYGVAVHGSTGKIYVTTRHFLNTGVAVFAPTGPIVVPDVTTEAPDIEPTSAVLRGTVDPDGIDTTDCYFEWGKTTSYGNKTPCAEGQVFSGNDPVPVSAEITGLKQGDTYNFRLVAINENKVPSVGANRAFKPQGSPVIIDPYVSEVNTDGARLHAAIEPNGGITEYHFEWGPEDCATAADPCNATAPSTLPTHVGEQEVTLQVAGLDAGTEYHFRVIATNDHGTTTGADAVFSTFPNASKDPDTCANAHVRQQTGANLLLDCRAYELVSAANTGGYDVISDLVPGQSPLITPPGAKDKVLYSVHHGTIPGVAGNPTNFGIDPYVATRGEDGWTTRYVGIPANGTPDNSPFASDLIGSSSSLSAFAFGGPDICNPCFPDGTGIPVRTPSGELVQGMAGSLPGAPIPAGEVRRHFSDDGRVFVFGSESKFEPAGNEGSVTIYARDLVAKTTRVVSTLPNGSTMTGDVGQLDLSADGSRVLVGEAVGSDAAGNDLWRLYMNVASSANSIAITPGAAAGVLFAGMTDDGSTVYFVSTDQLTPDDSDNSADLYRASLSGGSATLSRVSTGSGAGNTDACDPVPGATGPHWNRADSTADCGVVAFAGGAGVAADDGTVYFLSPEALDGEGVVDEPNLYVVRPGAEPELVATLEPDHRAIEGAVTDAARHNYSHFQVTADGEFAAFDSRRSLTGFVNLGHAMVYRYAAAVDRLDCASCATTGAAPSSDATLSPYGLNLTDDGRVFFTSGEALVLRDTNNRKDAYQWKDGQIQVVSTGASPTDSGLLSVDPDGVNAYFFTREAIVPQDRNGTTMKIYVAREGGGYPTLPPRVPCQASDECHGPSSAQPAPPLIGTLKGDGGQYIEEADGPPTCKRNQVRRKGRCVKRPRPTCRRNQVRRKGRCVKRSAKRGKRAPKRAAKRVNSNKGRSA